MKAEHIPAQPLLTMDVLHRVVRVRRMCTSGAAAKIRVDGGVTLREIGALVGVPAATVSKWENGQRVPGLESALKYGDVLDLIRRATAEGEQP